ncbi:MAG TPA: hypothetical protein VGH20_08890 [Myxococcales bacterium]|jgi:hypothetical protein
MRNIRWVAAAGLLVGCAMGGQQTKQSETVSAQSQATQSFQAAADAQKRATDEQQKAEQAHQDVIQAQKALAEAQAKMNAQQAKADQAQADAQRLASAATEQGQMSQQQAQQAMQTETQEHQSKAKQNLQQWTQNQEVQGTVISAGSDQVSVRTDDSQTLNLGVNDTTAITLDGKTASAQQLMPGTDVRASYQMIDGKATAVKVRAHSSQQGTTQQQQR